MPGFSYPGASPYGIEPDELLVIVLPEEEEEEPPEEEVGPGPEPGKRILSPLALRMLDDLPPVLRESADYQALINAQARECELAAEKLEVIRRQFVASKADVLLGLWERLTQQQVAPMGASIAERRDAVVARLRKILALGEGSSWEAQVTLLVGPGWDYQEHDDANPASPPEGVVRIKLPFGHGDARYARARSEIRQITQAHIELVFSAEGGFILDESELDVVELVM